VPFIIRGPGIKPGTCSHVRTIGQDLFPTIAELAKASGPLPNGIEGGSMAKVLLNAGNGTVSRPREELVFHFPHYDKDSIGPASAIILGDLKLVRIYETGELRLYNIVKDPGERHNLAHEMPEKVKELDKQLTGYLAAVNAQIPGINPNYNPDKPSELQREGKGKEKKKKR
jgi:arylsulfatase A